MKKSFMFLAALTIMIQCFVHQPLQASALMLGDWEITVSGNTWTLIKYHGTMTETFELPTAVGEYPVSAFTDTIFRWNNNIKNIVIPSGYQEIPPEGFTHCQQLETATTKKPTPTASAIYQNGKAISPMAFSIDGNNYFKLRDLGKLFNFYVGWDKVNNSIIIDTSASYAE